ncbi:uncharacterized protein si:rp71-46j2.7 isoform X2 [Takifugu flavidus]|uniref:uncharacterized protein si:rp71-46j2.7 isoform X2 n=1 Tax=Takifugu flavidus TaxID=433684 RepID=UPI002544BEC7|nr:uncharacterized protein si:rp71-46j2.7 isoform X2 [Takifugu flavidus]
MFPWRLPIAVLLGLAWCFSDCVRAVAQYFLCFLFCFTAPLLVASSGRDGSTQTDGEAKESPPRESVEEDDVTDGEKCEQAEPLGSKYPHVFKSLQQVFECAYAQLVLPWYSVPEPREAQPLHRVLSREVDVVIDRIIERARHFDVCQAVVGSIRILTQHLHNAKQPDRELLFTSRTEEITVLREFSDALVRNLFSKSLWSHEVHRCALNEIVATKGLGLIVRWLSDPDNLNQLVVSQLDRVTPKSSVEDLCGSDLDLTSLASQEGDGSEVSFEESGSSTSTKTKTKTRANKIKQGWSKIVDKMKSKRAKKKKMKMVEAELVMRIMALQENEEDVSSREGSIHSLQESDRDSDLENYMTSVQEDMMEFKLSYEMWRVGRWAVSIPQAGLEDDELTFTVHVEEEESPENLQWDIKKTYMDVIHFRNRWQDSTSLPSITALASELEVNAEVNAEVTAEVTEDTRAAVERFLQELVSDHVIGHTQPVFQFLCPLDTLLNEDEHYGGVWGLLSGLAYFLTPGQEEEESSSPQTEGVKERPSLNPESTDPPEIPGTSSGKSNGVPGATIPTIIVSEYEPVPEQVEETKPEQEPRSAGTCSEDKTEDSDNPLTHFKMIFKGLSRSRSQESLSKTTSEEDPPQPDVSPRCGQNGAIRGETSEGSAWRHFNSRLNKKEKTTFKVLGGATKAKGREGGTLPRGEDSQCQKSQVNWEQMEATKAIFDLLKEISGNSILLNIFDAILKPVMPILKKKVNSFLDKMNPTEAQMASYIDLMCGKLWPEPPSAAAAAPRTEEEKSESRERAHGLISARYSNYIILKKTDMETVFNIFQNCEENKTLVYMLLSFLLRELFPDEHSLSLSAAALQKGTSCTH